MEIQDVRASMVSPIKDRNGKGSAVSGGRKDVSFDRIYLMSDSKRLIKIVKTISYSYRKHQFHCNFTLEKYMNSRSRWIRVANNLPRDVDTRE